MGARTAEAVHATSNNYRGTTTPWIENGLTWNNAPPLTSQALDSTGAVADGAWVEFDVTGAITATESIARVPDPLEPERDYS